MQAQLDKIKNEMKEAGHEIDDFTAMFMVQVALRLCDDPQLQLEARANSREQFLMTALDSQRFANAVIDQYERNQQIMEQAQNSPQLRAEMAKRVYRTINENVT